MKRILSLTLLACLTFAGCDNFLDIKPKDIFIPSTLQHYEGMLNNAHIMTLNDIAADYFTDDAYLPEYTEEADPPYPALNLYKFVGIQPPYISIGQKIYKFDPKAYTEADSDMAWSEAHHRLFYYNTVANQVMEIEDGTEQQRRTLQAEALLQRAIEHFYLVNLYAMHYDPATAAAEPGIPIAVEADLSAQYNRSTVAQTYAHILDDLEKARAYLPEAPSPNKYRASQAAGMAMTAKVYLTMGDYNNALTWVEDALAVHDELLDMNAHDALYGWRNFGPGLPVIHVANGPPVEWSSMPKGLDNPETILNRHHQQPFGLAGGGSPRVCASPELVALYGKNIDDRDGDMRWKLWYVDTYMSSGLTPFSPTFLTTYGVRLFWRGDYYNICLGTPEMLLIRAECNARNGEMGKALADINELRRHRIRPESFVELISADFGNDAEQVLRFVLEERRRELPFTGNRLIDLKRLNKDPRFAKTVTHTVDGVDYTLEPNSRRYMRELWPRATKFNPQWPLNFPNGVE